MPIIRNILFMSVSTGFRLGFGILTFVVMARLLGPDAFGVIMVWVSVSTILTILSNFGFAPYCLREIGVSPHLASVIMREVLAGKLIVTVLVMLLAIAAMPFVTSDVRVVFILVLVSVLADSFTEFLNIGFRATNHYALEARVATFSALILFAVTSSLLWLNATVINAAIALLVSRLAILTSTWLVQRRHLGPLGPSSLADGLSRLRGATAYAVDGSLQNLFGQIDSVVLNHYLGPSVVGIYQSGMRLFMGAAQAANVLSNVFLPRAAESIGRPTDFEREARTIQLAFVLTGALFGLAFAIFANEITTLVFGAQYDKLATLLPWFGFLYFVRFVAAAWGIVLTSCGMQTYRARVSLAHWILIFAWAAYSIPLYGTEGWLMALIAGNLALGLAYLVQVFQIVRPKFQISLLVACVAITFVPYLHLPVVVATELR